MLVITNTISHYRANGHITKGGAMSREMSSLIQQLKTEQLEVKLALQCAPLIAGLKVSNLLIISKKDEFRLLALIKNSGFCAYSLLQSYDKVTFLLFNRYQLGKIFWQPHLFCTYFPNPGILAFHLMKYSENFR